jgi:hypothetical protein
MLRLQHKLHVVHFVFFKDVWIRNQKGAVACRRAYQLISPISYIYFVSQEKRAEPFSFTNEKTWSNIFCSEEKIMLVSFGAGHSPAFGTWFIPYLNDSSVLSEAR